MLSWNIFRQEQHRRSAESPLLLLGRHCSPVKSSLFVFLSLSTPKSSSAGPALTLGAAVAVIQTLISSSCGSNSLSLSLCVLGGRIGWGCVRRWMWQRERKTARLRRTMKTPAGPSSVGVPTHARAGRTALLRARASPHAPTRTIFRPSPLRPASPIANRVACSL